MKLNETDQELHLLEYAVTDLESGEIWKFLVEPN